jgi:hypothetical protein
MKSHTKIIIAITILLCTLIYNLQIMAMGPDDAPQTVILDSMKDLYEGVTFDHEMHMELYDCSRCHHHTTGSEPTNTSCTKCHATSAATAMVACSGCHEITGGLAAASLSTEKTNPYHIDKPSLKGALHLQCLGCHSEEDGPTDCQDCHALTAAGRKRFLLEK